MAPTRSIAARRPAIFVPVLAAAALLVAGCVESDAPSDEPAQSGQEQSQRTTGAAEAPAPAVPAVVDTPAAAQLEVLQAIPATTPYVFVATDPASFDELPWQPEELLPLYDSAMEGLADAVERNRGDDPADGAVARLLHAVGGELEGKLSAEGIASFGVDLEGTWAVYGLGIFPAARVPLADPGATDAAVQRILAAADVEVTTRAIDDTTVHVVSLPRDWQLAVTVVDDTLAATVAPQSATDELVELLVRGPGVDASLATAGTFDEIAATYAPADEPLRGLGWIDVVAIADAFAGTGDPLARRTLDAVGAPRLDGVCATEWRSIASQFPRIVAVAEPVSLFDVRRAEITVELADPELRASLDALRAELGDLAAPADAAAPIFVASANIDVRDALQWAADRAAPIVDEPFACESLHGVNTAAARITAAPLIAPTAIQEIAGGHFVIDDFALVDDKPRARGWGHVESGDLDGLWDLAAPALLDEDGVAPRVVPAIGDGVVDVPLRGRIARRVPQARVQRLADDRLELRFGTDAPADWQLRADDPAPLLRIGWDGGKMWQSWIERRGDDWDDQRLGRRSLWAELTGRMGLRTVVIDTSARGVTIVYERNSAL